ncbi:MAG: DUF1080 domain-containing protein [Cyclobacteriaceae bacterium]
MKTKNVMLAALLLLSIGLAPVQAQDGDWISLFDGKSLEGWKASENPATFSVEDGKLKVAGPRAHLFYVGPVSSHNFKNFEFKALVMTKPKANSGMYIHTEYQEKGWPDKGYEIQVNNSHSDWRRTGSLYSIDDVREVYVKDDEWYTEHIIVKDNRITVKINEQTVVDYYEPENVERDKSMAGRKLSSGTVALQGHDPESVVYYKDIMIRLLD